MNWENLARYLKKAGNTPDSVFELILIPSDHMDKSMQFSWQYFSEAVCYSILPWAERE